MLKDKRVMQEDREGPVTFEVDINAPRCLSCPLAALPALWMLLLFSPACCKFEVAFPPVLENKWFGKFGNLVSAWFMVYFDS